MNKINFIKTPPPDKQQSVYRWYRTSMYAIAALCSMLVLINGYQFYQLRFLGSTKKQLRQVTESTALTTDRIKQFANIQEQLEKQQTKLNAPHSFQPAQYLRAIASTIPDDTCLFTADLHKKGSLQLTGYTESADSLRTFMQALGTSPLFGKLELTSLQPESTQNTTLYRFTMTAQLQSV